MGQDRRVLRRQPAAGDPRRLAARGRDHRQAARVPEDEGADQAELNFGMTSLANQRSCSSITAFGVPRLMLMLTCRRPGNRASRYAWIGPSAMVAAPPPMMPLIP